MNTIEIEIKNKGLCEVLELLSDTSIEHRRYLGRKWDNCTLVRLQPFATSRFGKRFDPFLQMVENSVLGLVKG